MNDMINEGRAFGWDDEFTNEQQEFVLLPEGEYPTYTDAYRALLPL